MSQHGGILLPLNGYYPVSISLFPPGAPIQTYEFNYNGGVSVSSSIAYVANGSGFAATSLPGSPPAGNNVISSLKNYQAPVTLSRGAVTTVNFGGGSSYLASSSPLIPSGPHPPVDTTGGSAVQSILSGGSYNDYGHVFTHSVVNIDNNSTFHNTTVQYNGNTYNFPSLGAVIEAALGNLESQSTAKAAGENLGALGLSQSDLQSGYYSAYMQAALAATQPMITVANSTVAFMTQLATVSNIHFGCVTFNDYVGTNASSTAPPSGTAAYNLASSYPYPAMGTNADGTTSPSVTNTYALPDILLDPTSNTTQSTIASVLPTVHTWGNCNVAGGLQAALSQLNAQTGPSGNSAPITRVNANKAIVLITTQPPNVGLNGDSGSAALSDAVTMAQACGNAGIPIYCLSVTQPDSGSGSDAAYKSIVAAAGHGGHYYSINWSNTSGTQAALTSAFGNIARQLVSVIR